MISMKMYVPQNIQELLELVVSMQLMAPKFIDKTGYFPYRNLDYVFRQLYEGLAQNQQTLGDDRYEELMRMSDRIRALFEADPEDNTGETSEGRKIINQMEDILLQVRRTQRRG